MIKESYISNWKNLPADAIKVRVAQSSVLSASIELFSDDKGGRISGQDFEAKFRKEIITNPKAMAELKRLKQLSLQKDVYLIRYEKNHPCHPLIQYFLRIWTRVKTSLLRPILPYDIIISIPMLLHSRMKFIMTVLTDTDRDVFLIINMMQGDLWLQRF